MNITSNARWSKIEDSRDTHYTITEAECICKILRQDYSDTPCDVRGYCLGSWVEIDGVRQ